MGQKSGQRVQNWPNKNQVASDLLRESTDSVIRAAEGIHQFCPPTYWGNPLFDNFSIRPAEGIHRFCHRSYWGNPSILSSDLLRESIRTNQLGLSCKIGNIPVPGTSENQNCQFYEIHHFSLIFTFLYYIVTLKHIRQSYCSDNQHVVAYQWKSMSQGQTEKCTACLARKKYFFCKDKV